MSTQYDILLVEDEQVVVDAARKVLLSEGFNVDEALDAEVALDKIDRHDYEVILSDLMLPNITGLELLRKVKNIDPNIPFILITGYATLENAVKCFKVGAFDFIPKPFDAAELLGVVRRGISHRKIVRAQAGQGEGFEEVVPAQGQDDAGEYRFLGHHSWAKIDSDGVTVFGLAETFPNQMGKILRVDYPPVDAEVLQGNLCVRIVTDDSATHMVWAPLSGKVVDTNHEVEENVELLNTDPFHRGWLVKVIPTNIESELENLTVR